MNVISSPPFNLLGDIRSVVLKDHFIGVDAVADAALPLTIVDGAGAGGSAIAVVASEANHPGIVALGSGATTPADGDLGALVVGAENDDSGILLSDDENGVYFAVLLRLTDVTNSKVEVGLSGQAMAAVNSSALDLISVVFDPEDADNTDDALFFLQLNTAGTDSEEIFDEVTYTQDRWVLIELAAVHDSVWGRVSSKDSDTADLEIQEKSINSATPDVVLNPFVQIEAVGAAEETVEIDAMVVRYTVGRESNSLGDDRIYV